MNIEDKYSTPIPKLCNIGDWSDIPIADNLEPLVNIISLNNKQIIYANYYHNLGLDGAIDQCLLRETVALKLDKIAKRLPSAYSLYVYDGWRPYKLQKAIFTDFKNTIKASMQFDSEKELEEYVIRFVSPGYTDPSHPSPHFTGGAVDITIMKGGNVLNMGSKFDATIEMTYTEHYEDILRDGRILNAEELSALNNRRLLYNIMAEEDFTVYQYEWWHFDFGNQLWAKTKNKISLYGYSDYL